MFGTLSLILLLVFLFFVMLIAFFFRQNRVGRIVLIVSGICTAFILVTNLDFLLSPRTKKQVYKVVDAETQKPVPNARVVIGWAVHYATVASSPRCYYKVVRTVTDASGEFIVPPALKSINFSILGFYTQRFSGIDLGVFDYSLIYKPAILTSHSDSLKIIQLVRRTTAKEIIKGFMSTYRFLDITRPNCSTGPLIVDQTDILFFKNSYSKLEALYPGSVTDRFEDGYEMSDVFDKLNQPEAYLILRQLVQKHTNKKNDMLSARLNRYRKLYMEKGGYK